MAVRPWNTIGCGGMVATMSARIMARAAAASPCSWASMNRRRTSCSAADSGAAVHWLRSRGSRSRSAARARCSALFTAAVLVARVSAASAAVQPRPAHSTSAARCRGGKAWMAVMKASSMVSRAIVADSGPPAWSGIWSSSASG